MNNLLCLPDKVNFEEKFSLLFSDHVLATGFTTCDKTCGGGIRLRMIKVNNRQVLQRRSCNVQNCPGKGAAIFLPFVEKNFDPALYRHKKKKNRLHAIEKSAVLSEHCLTNSLRDQC